MKKIRLLTKSRFKVGSECPTKLFYLDDPSYASSKTDDPFLMALAEGGFQVGELAKVYYPDGMEVLERDYESSVDATNKLLTPPQATVFEGAIRFADLFVRIDILNKNGNYLELIEVKAKSIDPTEIDQFFTKKGGINSDWEPYLLDVAFQTYVAKKAHPTLIINSYLMLADKSSKTSTDALNQRFLIAKDDKGKTIVTVRPGTTKKDLGTNVLCKVDVTKPVNYILETMFGGYKEWEAHVDRLAKLVTTQTKSVSPISSSCKSCEFRIDKTKFDSSKKSGFEECWVQSGNSLESLARPLIFDIWNFRKSQSLIESGRYFMDEVTEDDINIKESDELGLSSSERQWLQVQKSKSSDTSAYCDLKGLAGEFRIFKYPFHFIDFETTMVAIPFNQGRRPYEQVAFQFSHHVLNQDGTIEHRNQFIHRERGTFPNFEFVQALKKSLEADEGTIFRYSNHENTVLRKIREQIYCSTPQLPDSEELISWIDTITSSTGDEKKHVGKRTMKDLCELVKKYYYSPYTKGSNSIKKVLPAILKDSSFLAAKYSQPIYGSLEGPTSLNFRNWAWLQRDQSGNMMDPYKLLPPTFTEEELSSLGHMVTSNEISDGGAAMMAFAKMQFTEMSEAEAAKLQDSLLKYCELDTFAMVMIVEHWSDQLRIFRSEAA